MMLTIGVSVIFAAMYRHNPTGGVTKPIEKFKHLFAFFVYSLFTFYSQFINTLYDIIEP